MATVTYWVNCPALGDAICCIPIVKALIAEGKLYKVLIPKKFCELFWVCDVDRKYIVESTKESVATFKLNGSESVSACAVRRAPYRIHLVDMFSVFSLNAILKPEEKCNKANPDRLPKPKVGLYNPYIVLGIGYALESRKMPLEVFEAVVRYCKHRNIDVVLLGGQRQQGTKQPIVFDGYPREGCIDMIDRTTMTASVAIMKDAACVVGIDSGLIYLASLTDVPIVSGFTFVDPYYRMPYRHGVKGWQFYPIEPKGECKYCSNKLAMFGVEFDTKCPLGMAYECVTTLDSKDFIKALKKIQSGRPKMVTSQHE